MWTGIIEFGEDYIYSDTDSIKGLNFEKHREYVEEYNRKAIEKLKRTLDYWNLPYDLIFPKNIKGEEKPLGVWTNEGTYKRFKFLGAKRYLVEDENGMLKMTVSGLNPAVAIYSLCKGWCTDVRTKKENFDPFEKFNDKLYIPKGQTGKLTHTYIDTEISGTVVDYLGNEAEYNEKSFVHLEEADYSLGVSETLTNWILEMIGEGLDDE